MRLRGNILPYIISICFFVLYLHNLSRSVYGGDVGDFVTTAAIGGVAHPPGYPFFTLLGFLLTRITLFPTPAFAVGLISVFASVGGLVLFYLIVAKLTKNSIVSFVSTLTLGVSYLYWLYAEIAEVFALHSFFIILLFYLAISFDKERKIKLLFLFSFILGLAAITHQTILFFIPSYLLLLMPAFFKQKKKVKKLLIALVCLVSPALFYGYVLIASIHNPAINWDHVHDLSSFLRLVLRQDYGTFSAGTFSAPTWLQRFIILKTYLFTLLTQVTIPVITLAVLGLVMLFQKSKRYAVSLLLAFIISGPVFIFYAGFPLNGTFFFGVNERFFVMSSIMIFFFYPFGIDALAQFFVRLFQRPIYGIIFPALFLLLPVQLFFYNMNKTDLSSLWLGDQVGYDFLAPLPHDAVLLLGGDTALFNTWYMHYAKGVRPDITVININGIRDYPLYKQLEKNNPKLDISTLIEKTITQLTSKHEVFSYDQVHVRNGDKFTWIPYGMVSKLYINNAHPLSHADFVQLNQQQLNNIHFSYSEEKINEHNYTVADIPRIYAKAYLAVGNYALGEYKDKDFAIQNYLKAIASDPNYDAAYTTIGIYYLTQTNQCNLAEKNLLKAIGISDYVQLPYFLLYTTYTECFHDKQKANAVISAYKKEFHEDFFTDLGKMLKDYKK